MKKDTLLSINFNKKTDFEIVLENTLKAHLLYPLILIPLFLSCIIGYPILLYKFFKNKIK